MALLSESGFLFLLRWIHFLSGVTWIGLLYYFNFVQTPFFAETEAPVRSGAQQKLLPRAMWWFRWGAMITFLSGWLYLLHWWIGKRGLADPQTWVILLGGIIGSVMWANVWFVIHPKQKIVIQNALDTAAGKPANPAAAAAGAGHRRRRPAASPGGRSCACAIRAWASRRSSARACSTSSFRGTARSTGSKAVWESGSRS